MTVFERSEPKQARSEETRRRILDATASALHALGYTRTTTAEVCRGAGVSRGTVLHHFPTRAALVTASVEYLFMLRLGEFREAIAAVPPDADKVTAVIDLLWHILTGPAYYAWLELVVAARTDPELRTELAGVMERFNPEIDAAYRAVFPPPDDPGPEYELGPGFVFATLGGLAVDRIYQDPAVVERIVTALKLLAGVIEAATSAGE